jgi:hypothetical protein
MTFKCKVTSFKNELIRIAKEQHEVISLAIGLNCLFAYALSDDFFLLLSGLVLTTVSLVDLFFDEVKEVDEK